MKTRPIAFIAVLASAVARADAGRAWGRVDQPDAFVGTASGHWPTASVAIANADDQTNGHYYGCKLPYYTLASDHQSATVWWAEV